MDTRLKMCLDILEGVRDMQSVDIIHSDIKPGNILVSMSGDKMKKLENGSDALVIMDLGLSTNVHDMSEAMAGTPAFTAPEQASGRQHRLSDNYSVGIVLASILLDKDTFWNSFFRSLKDKANEIILEEQFNHTNSYRGKAIRMIMKLTNVITISICRTLGFHLISLLTAILRLLGGGNS